MKKPGFKERLQSVRLARGLTKMGLEQKAGLSLGHITRVETGERAGVSIEVAARIAEVLEVDLGWLITGKLPQRDWKPPV